MISEHVHYRSIESPKVLTHSRKAFAVSVEVCVFDKIAKLNDQVWLDLIVHLTHEPFEQHVCVTENTPQLLSEIAVTPVMDVGNYSYFHARPSLAVLKS
jgi:hypothetical protein